MGYSSSNNFVSVVGALHFNKMLYRLMEDVLPIYSPTKYVETNAT